MSFTTVGEVMERLKTFDPSTPMLIDDGHVYRTVNIETGLLYRVIPVIKGPEDTEEIFIDADPRHPHSFDAVVL